MTATAARIAGGDLDAKVETTSSDEVGVLAAEFNRMAASLRQLRQSDMGQLVIAQQTTEAAIDGSSWDAVLLDQKMRAWTVSKLSGASRSGDPARGS
jgi:nitrogen fixation/metabolism regulation signal transduction histidine kinase